MTTRPPPPRYRIVERDGRLVTIDTWAKQAPPPPRASPASAGNAPYWRAFGDLLLSALLRTRDDAGRRLLTTGPSWDQRGPRTIALDRRGEQRLGTALGMVALAVLAAVVAVIIDPDLIFWVIVLGVLLASSLGTVAHGAMTRLLDSLDRDLPDREFV